jgi:hypothetical protein
MLGAIVRGDLGSGLQTQTYALTRMLKPDRLLYIDSTVFNHGEQRPELYDGFTMQKSNGFPTNLDSVRFMRGLTHLITAETIYNHKMYEVARATGCKVFTQLNWEFLDHLVNPHMPKPYMWLMPSYWMYDEMKAKFPNTIYLPPPIIMSDFKRAREANLDRRGTRRFLHVMGKVASHDRNGTYDLLDAMKYSTGNFILVIRSQYPVSEYMERANDSRIQFDIGNVEDQCDMYDGFDAMIIPRRYGGLCLPMNEALSSALPVIMPDISPNNRVLPNEWLVAAQVTHQFQARTKIDVNQTDVVALGKKLDWLAELSDDDLQQQKLNAYDLALQNYSSETLKPIYEKVMEL